MNEKNNKHDIISDVVNEKALAEYLTAESGKWLGVYADGTYAIAEAVGSEINPEERPIACVKCPGIGNIDAGFFTDGWTTYNRESGMYETDDGREFTLAECIVECCESGDVVDELDELLIELAERS